ncbi:uncharacterized protein LOC106674243 [Cimex lectularius]|uniref:Uncharacterized protein n=1 Tax=Cimex lectularius TaxID=79782 RepID=A0A8I6TI30_CIMLE|nr:uncharacterized protein LOC106674243 [Cimex lectularius]
MDTLEGDLKELRALRKTAYLSQDSKSVSYDARPLVKKERIQTYKNRRTSRYELKPTFGPTKFVYEEPQSYPMFSEDTYKLLRYGAMILDVLALLHVIPAPFDHPCQPFPYPSLPKPNQLRYKIVEPDDPPSLKS